MAGSFASDVPRGFLAEILDSKHAYVCQVRSRATCQNAEAIEINTRLPVYRLLEVSGISCSRSSGEVT